MFFKGVIEKIINSKFDIDQFLFGDLIGLSERTVRNLKKDPDIKIPSKRHTQLMGRIDNSIKKSTEKGLILKYVKSLLEKPINENEIAFLGSLDSFKAVSTNLLNSGIDIDTLGTPHCLYSMSFLDLVYKPLFKLRVDELGGLAEHFPYSSLSKEEFNYYVDKVKKSEPFCNDDPLLFRSVVNSFVAVLAAMYMDVERYNRLELDKDISSFRRLISEAWSSENSSAYFFKFSRKELNYKTHEEFYNALSVNFPNHDKETVKRNYKRWCKTGKIDRRQWPYLTGAGGNWDEITIIEELKHTFISLLDEIKGFALEHDVEYSSDDFLEDLDRWCSEIEANVSLDSWQPAKATSD